MADPLEERIEAELSKAREQERDRRIEQKIETATVPRDRHIERQIEEATAPPRPVFSTPTPGRASIWWQSRGPWSKVLILFAAFLVGAAVVGALLGDAPLGHPDVDTVSIEYTGCWSGSVGGGGSQASYEGCGPRRIPVSGWPVAAAVQKMDDGFGPLTVRLLDGSETVASSTTYAQYGVATASA